MAVYKLNQETKKETTEDRLRKAINLGRREALKEVLEWLDEITDEADDGCDHSMVYFTSFDYKEQMFQSFKERFNIVDDCDQQHPSDLLMIDNYDCK